MRGYKETTIKEPITIKQNGQALIILTKDEAIIYRPFINFDDTPIITESRMDLDKYLQVEDLILLT